MSRNALVLRHVLHEGLGVFEPILEEAGWDIAITDVPVEGVCSHGSAFDADLLIIMGGPCGAYEVESYPWLPVETAVIRDRVTAGKPTLGICLGAQLIAGALGARVYPGDAGQEIGWGLLTLTEAGQVGPLAALGGVPVMHWHGDTFDLPEGATLLASTDRYRNQAFAVGDHVLGMQFHPEVDGRNIEHWLIGQAGVADLTAMRAGARAHGMTSARASGAMLRVWIGGLAPG